MFSREQVHQPHKVERQQRALFTQLHSLALASLGARTIVELARRLGVCADVDKLSSVSSLDVDTHNLSATVSRHALDANIALACVALWLDQNTVRNLESWGYLRFHRHGRPCRSPRRRTGLVSLGRIREFIFDSRP